MAINPATGLEDPNYTVGLGASVPTLPQVGISSAAPLANTNFDTLYANNNIPTASATTGVGLGLPSMQTTVDPYANINVGTPQAPASTTGIGDFGTMDYLNAGMGAVGLGLGAYYQNRQLGIQEDTLGLAQQKYSDYRADKDALTAANAERNANAIAKGA